MDTQDSRSVDSADLSLDSPDQNSTASTAAASQAVNLEQIMALLDNPAATRADILGAAARSAALVDDYDKKINEIRKRADSATDKLFRKYILLDVKDVEALRATAAQVCDNLRARMSEEVADHTSKLLGAALSSSPKKKDRFVEKLKGLPAFIADKASHARQNIVKERYEGLRSKLERVRTIFSEDSCDALLQEADKLAWVTIEASGDCREELLRTFREAVMAFVPSETQVTLKTGK